MEKESRWLLSTRVEKPEWFSLSRKLTRSQALEQAMDNLIVPAALIWKTTAPLLPQVFQCLFDCGIAIPE